MSTSSYIQVFIAMGLQASNAAVRGGVGLPSARWPSMDKCQRYCKGAFQTSGVSPDEPVGELGGPQRPWTEHGFFACVTDSEAHVGAATTGRHWTGAGGWPGAGASKRSPRAKCERAACTHEPAWGPVVAVVIELMLCCKPIKGRRVRELPPAPQLRMQRTGLLSVSSSPSDLCFSLLTSSSVSVNSEYHPT